MKKFNVLSVLLGAFTAIVGVSFIERMLCTGYSHPHADIIIDGVLMNAAETLPFDFYATAVSLNLAISFLSGTLPFIIGDERLKHSLIIGLITTFFAGINFCFMPFPFWYHLISMLLFVPSSYLGGYLLKKHSLNRVSYL